MGDLIDKNRERLEQMLIDDAEVLDRLLEEASRLEITPEDREALDRLMAEARALEITPEDRELLDRLMAETLPPAPRGPSELSESDRANRTIALLDSVPPPAPR